MLSQCQRNLLPRMFETPGLYLLCLSCQRYFKKIVAEKLSNFLERNSLIPPFFSYYKCLESYAALLTVSHHLQVALHGSVEGRFVQLDF